MQVWAWPVSFLGLLTGYASMGVASELPGIANGYASMGVNFLGLLTVTQVWAWPVSFLFFGL